MCDDCSVRPAEYQRTIEHPDGELEVVEVCDACRIAYDGDDTFGPRGVIQSASPAEFR